MQDLIIPVNNEALSRAFAAVLTPEQATLVGQAYTAIDKAMRYGFEKGIAVAAERAKIIETVAEANEPVVDLGVTGAVNTVQAAREAYDEGFNAGAAETLQNLRNMTAEEEQKHYEAGWITGRAEGYEAGFKNGYKAADGEYDDGYVDGVSDARSHPEFADDEVAALCDTEVYYDDQADIDGFDGTYSGPY